MEVVNVLHMNGGLGDSSYANNSLVQRKAISMANSIIEEAITKVHMSRFSFSNNPPNKMVLCIAELGCSSGPNTFFVPSQVIDIVNTLCHKSSRKPPQFQIYLNDLPGNDFNSIFQSHLPTFYRQLHSSSTSCFVSAVPGSFYGRLFLPNTIHFLHSSYSLMWLSKVPDGVEMNKDNIYISSATPPTVLNAYANQFQQDFSTFLRCRSEEVVSGGKMVLTILGRKSNDPKSKEGCYIWELLGVSLQQLVSEGLIEQHKLHSFHIPQYTPSPQEVATEVQKQGSFIIDHLGASEITWASCCPTAQEKGDCGYDVAKCMRSVAESLLIKHFGDAVIDHLFDIYRQLLSDCMSKEDPKFINVYVSMTRL